jgi:hypothetical protein
MWSATTFSFSLSDADSKLKTESETREKARDCHSGNLNNA